MIWIIGEFLYAFTSVLNRDDGDFGKIAKRSTTHLALATIALTSVCALGIFATISVA